MKIKTSQSEIEIEAQDVIDALTKQCPNAGWDSDCICGACFKGRVLNEEGLVLRKLMFTV